MGKNKMKLWRQWPSCNHPKTLSYRFNADDVYKTVNSVFFDTDPNGSATNAVNNPVIIDTPESWFTNSSESASFSTADSEDDESLETVVAGARSERRLFFEPRGKTNSILSAEESKPAESPGGALRESVAVAVESDDPYGDFRRSMAEMVETNGVKDWGGLEELLGWYLRVNGKENHGFVVGAFVDLLVDLSGNNEDEDENENVDSSGDDSTAAIATAAADSFLTAVSRFSSSSERGRSEIYEEERNLMTR